ncbi:transposase [Acinetobacter baumannii]
MLIQKLYAIETELRKRRMVRSREDRCEYEQQHSQPVMQQLYEWLNQHQLTVPSSSPTARAIKGTAFKRCVGRLPSRYLDDGNLPIDNKVDENQMRPWSGGA